MHHTALPARESRERKGFVTSPSSCKETCNSESKIVIRQDPLYTIAVALTEEEDIFQLPKDLLCMPPIQEVITIKPRWVPPGVTHQQAITAATMAHASAVGHAEGIAALVVL